MDSTLPHLKELTATLIGLLMDACWRDCGACDLHLGEPPSLSLQRNVQRDNLIGVVARLAQNLARGNTGFVIAMVG
jgi:hypothetical protein